MSNDIVLYINLDKRTDRKKLIELELKKLFGYYTRISAIDGETLGLNKTISNSVACAYSHIKALEFGLNTDCDNIFIFEDDFQLEVDIFLGKTLLNRVKNNDFNLILLSYHTPVVKLFNFNNNLAEIKNGQTTCSYVVKRETAYKLLEIFKESINKLIQTESLNDFSIDQNWKKLQIENNKIYGLIPRLGKQRKEFSNIENKFVNYGGTCFMGILSCEKNKSKILKQNLNGVPFQYKYFIGKPNITKAIVKGKIVYLPCGDNYEDLSDKTYEMIKWIITNNDYVDYIFKTDDDINFNFENLHSIYSDVLYKKIEYGGNVNYCAKSISEYHFGKCYNKTFEKPINLETTNYCSGGGYFLSENACRIILNCMDKNKSKTIFEDYSIGNTLNLQGIQPVEINLKNNACFW